MVTNEGHGTRGGDDVVGSAGLGVVTMVRSRVQVADDEVVESVIQIVGLGLEQPVQVDT